MAREDKTFPGAMIASMSIPWGEAKGDDDQGGYHLVWTRDLANSVMGLLAAGNVGLFRRSLTGGCRDSRSACNAAGSRETHVQEKTMRPTITRSIAGGMAGTAMMTFMMYVVAPMMGVHMDIAQMLGSMLDNSWSAGLVVHLINGAVIFPIVFATVLYNRLPGAPILKGTTWGVTLWILAQAVVMPMMGAGFFSLAMGGIMPAMGSLIGHLLYGGILGATAANPEPVAIGSIAWR